MLEKLRIIMLFAADFNFALKLVWGKRLVQHAEHYKVLGTENHGSRPGRQTTDALMEKLLIYEHARLTRTSVVTMDNDAKSCYDRIIKTLAMTACMSVGLPLMAAKMHNLTHHGMVHEIKSRHGLFSPYQGTDQDPLEGTGQGSGGSPAIWLTYVVSLLNAFRKFTTGIRILSPYSARMALLITAVFFVDDGMPGVNDAMEAKATRLDILLAQAESAAQLWERLLFVPGGALELTKCFVYILYWDLSHGKHRVVHPSEIPGCTPEEEQFRGPVSLTYGNDATTRHKIVTKSPFIGTRTLGVRIAPAGGWKEEFDERRAQARLLGIQVAGSGISHEAARVAYRAIVCPKLEYPLAVTQFTQKQCDRISSPVLRACLSQMGYNSNMPREVVYGPTDIGGIGMHDLYIEQGIKQITTLVGHVRQDSDTGRMMVNQLQWCQVQAGTSISLLESPRVPIDYIEDCWIMCIRDFLATYNFRIEIIDEARPR